MAAKFVILFVVAMFASAVLSAPAPNPDPKAQFLAATPVAYSVGALPYAYSSYVSPYASVVSPYAAAYAAYPGLAYSYTYPYAAVL